MALFTNLNRQVTRWSYDTTDFEYHKLSEVYGESAEGEVHAVHGVFITPGKIYDENPVAILDNCFLNLPHHQLSTVKTILASQEMIDAIEAGACGITIYSYISNYGTECYSVEWCDIDPDKIPF